MAKKRRTRMVTARKRGDGGRKRGIVQPGPTVGGRSPADDDVPLLTMHRGQLIRWAARGRRQPAGRPPTRVPNPPRRGRSKG